MSLRAQEIHETNIHKYRVYSHYLNPREHPDDDRRSVKPPSWELFDNIPHFTVMRRFQMDNNRLVRFAEDFDLYTLKYKLGDVIWPHNQFLSATNIPDMVKEMKNRNLFLFDIWGYVPGSGPGFWQQYELSQETSSLFNSELGEKWLGMDMGEQDGRYLLAYARAMYPAAGDRTKQYLYFHKHMSKIANDMRNKLATLVAVTYGHYLLKEGIYTMVGAEAAQMHPNGQVFYSFNRGAGKQYGVPWFGNASVFNRWGWKSYDNISERSGPNKGTSLSLLKRLLYSHILYNCMIVGFESGWTDGEKLSPIGRIQRSARQWVMKHGSPGVHQTPIALMTDFYAGWIFPNYNNIIYRVWGNLPYGPGDYLTNNVFNMFYPGYQESSFFHDESGFAVETPFGDNADALLSDAPSWLLNRYPVLVIAGELSGGLEIKDKLTQYVEQGGNLYITAGSLTNLPGGIAGVRCSSSTLTYKAGSTVSLENGDIKEQYGFELVDLLIPESTKILAKADGVNAVIQLQIGTGFVTVFASPFGISASAQNDEPIARIHDIPLVNPYPMLDHVRIFLESAFNSQQMFEVGQGLALITCRKDAGEYTLGISNNTWNELPFNIVSNIGEIVSLKELPIDASDKKATGYLPEGMEKTDLGKSDKNSIAGGDMRIFSVKVHETDVSEIPFVIPPANATNRILPLTGNENIQTQILKRPTFFQHFDGVLVDWEYLHQRDEKILSRETGWLQLQKVNLWVDLTSGINLFPDLRLVNNIGSEYERSMETIRDVIKKMNILGAENLIISLHKPVENNIDRKEMLEHIEQSVRDICHHANQKGITIHLRTLLGNDLLSPMEESYQFVENLNLPNLKLALNTASLIARGISVDELKVIEPGKIGVWMVSAPEKDLSERLWNINAPVANSEFEKELAELLRVAPELPLIHDILLNNTDQEYEESKAVDKIVKGL
jgi:hypothetical protein